MGRMSKPGRLLIGCLVFCVAVFSTSAGIQAKGMQGGDTEAKVYDASLAEKLEGAFLQRLGQQELRGNLPNVEDGVTILGTAVGDTRVCFGWTTSGYTYLDDTEQGIARSIWDVLLSIVSYFVNTAGNIILDVASFLGVTCDRDQGATSRLLHSYRYITKYAQVYEPSLEWKTWYTSRSREWYRHEYASFVNTLGDTETDTIDYTYTRGYSPINTDWCRCSRSLAAPCSYSVAA